MSFLDAPKTNEEFTRESTARYQQATEKAKAMPDLTSEAIKKARAAQRRRLAGGGAGLQGSFLGSLDSLGPGAGFSAVPKLKGS